MYGIIGDLMECVQDLVGFYTGGVVASANSKKLARNIERHPEIIKNYTAHSQGTLILANALRILGKERKTAILKDSKITMNGSPVSMKVMEKFAEKYGIEFKSKVNKGDPVTCIGVNKSNTTSSGHTGKGNIPTEGYNNYQEFNEETGKYEVNLTKYNGNIHLINDVKCLEGDKK